MYFLLFLHAFSLVVPACCSFSCFSSCMLLFLLLFLHVALSLVVLACCSFSCFSSCMLLFLLLFLHVALSLVVLACCSFSCCFCMLLFLLLFLHVALSLVLACCSFSCCFCCCLFFLLLFFFLVLLLGPSTYRLSYILAEVSVSATFRLNVHLPGVMTNILLFQCLVGHKYGPSFLPEEMTPSQYEILREELSSRDDKMASLMARLYTIDESRTPPVFAFRKISVSYNILV